MAEEVKVAQPKEYIQKFLEQDIRPDGRELGCFRNTLVDIGSKHGTCISTAEGSSLVRLGNTMVACGIKAELAEPKTETPDEGFIVPNVELSPLCSSQFRPGPPGEQAQALSQFVLNVLKNSQCVLLEDLCISKGKKVWVLYIDMVCLNHDGNVADACVLAMTAALSNTILPIVTVAEETEKIEVDFKQEFKVPLRNSPISSTVAIYDESVLLVDPTRFEEDMGIGAVTVVTDGSNICCMDKTGGYPLTDAQMKLCIERAIQRQKEASQLITVALESVTKTLAQHNVHRTEK